MSEKSFLRDNAVLIMGLLLPAILVGLVAVVNFANKKTVPEPEYAVLFYQSDNYHEQFFDIKVKDGEIHFKRNDKNTNENINEYIDISLMLYHPDFGIMTEQIIVAMKDQAIDKASVKLNDTLANLQYEFGNVAPDRYRLVHHYRRSSPFGFFGSGRYRTELIKDGARYIIPVNKRYRHHDPRTIGWVKVSELGAAK